MYINLLLIQTSHLIMAGLQNAFINATCSSLEHIREMLTTFIVSEVITPKRRISFQTTGQLVQKYTS
jgi:hypothetical protein